MERPRVACVTCRVLPEPDPDQEILLDAIRRRGADASLAAWDDPDVAWDRYDVCVLRSAWNYYHDRPGFLAWARRVDGVSRLENPLSVVEDNTDKRYLARLAAAGVPIVPTEIVAPGERPELDALLARRGWDDVVIKPLIGAASHRNLRARPGQEARAHLAELAAGPGALLQPYLQGVEEPGERSIIWIDGAVTHAIRKTARFWGEDERVSLDAVPIPLGGEALLLAALAALGHDELVYARVDVVPDAVGELAIMEVELTEPSLYLAQSDVALERFADALVREAAQRAASRSRR
ncbi:MAG: RimK family alpha-L-glutamate ligase [Sandaracinaceae bacterium]